MKNGREKSNRSSLKWMINSIKAQKATLIIIMIMTCILSCAGSIIALVVGLLVDSATSGVFGSFIGFAILLVSIYVIDIIISALTRYLTNKCKASIENDMRHRFFEAVLNKEYSRISEYHSGELMNRMTSDVSVVADAAAHILPTFAGLIIRFVCAVVMVLYIQPLLAIFYTLGGVAVFFVAKIFRTKIKKLHKIAQKTEDTNRSFWQETLYNLLVVKVFTAQKNMLKKSDELQNKSFGAKMDSNRFSVFASTGYSLILSLGYVFAFIWCGVSLLYGLMSFGTMMTIIQLIDQLQSPFSGMSGVFTQYYVAVASAERLMEIERMPAEPVVNYLDPTITYDSMSSLSFNDVTFSYDRDDIFSNLSLKINKGEFVGIIGNSGIGKSTLFKLILGVYSPDIGDITIDCINGRYICDAAARRLFAYVPQGNMVFSGTVRDNILMINPNADDKMIDNAVKISCCDEFINELPNGLNTEIGEKGLGLSEGQVQRIAIARALVAKAPILLLDEATSALDGATETKVLNNLRGMNGITSLIVTHRMKALSVCDRILHIEQGKIQNIQ